jgi:pimeloyl-ACP methyl ester carboxylesterase
MAAKPTIVLVHGAWADGSSWDGVASILQHDGYTVDVAPNPLRGLTYDTAYLQDYLASISGPIVLVGHSYGGAVITDAATGNANVKALVYDDAYLPALGENITTLSTAQSALAPAVNDPASVFRLAQYPDPPAAGVVDTYLLPSVVAADFAPDVSPAEQALLTATQSPTSLAALGQSSTEPAWKTIPSWDVIGRQDKIIPEAAQLMMAHRAGSHITEIDSSHVSLISHPAEVAAVILKAACATS